MNSNRVIPRGIRVFFGYRSQEPDAKSWILIPKRLTKSLLSRACSPAELTVSRLYIPSRVASCRITRKTGGKTRTTEPPPCVIYPKGGKGNARSKPGKDMVSRPKRDGIGSRLCEGKVLVPLRIRHTRRDPRTKGRKMVAKNCSNKHTGWKRHRKDTRN